jgi:hypothetical protein
VILACVHLSVEGVPCGALFNRQFTLFCFGAVQVSTSLVKIPLLRLLE